MPDLQPYMTYVYAALVVLAALVVFAVLMKLLNGRARGRRGQRLGIVEYCEIDQSRRLVLLRRDNVEHLVLIGGGHDVVVETGINSETLATPASPPTLGEPTPEAIVPMRAPRAPVFGAKRPALRTVEPPHEDDQTPA